MHRQQNIGSMVRHIQIFPMGNLIWHDGYLNKPMNTMIIRPMQREELDILVEWAAAEGWNPGLDDADVFWATDPEGFIAAELNGELIGGGSIVNYAGLYGFMGFFIIRSDCRGQGFGNTLWHERKRLLLERLNDTAAIGMDGVFDMQHYYAKGGFSFVCRDLRYEGKGQLASYSDTVVELDQVLFDQVDAYDRRHFPAPRTSFLKSWIDRPGGHAVGVIHESKLTGYAVMRPCRVGYKIGPLFADDAVIANDLLTALSCRVVGEPIFLDVPESNPAAIQLANRHGMSEVFGCAKMIYGAPPKLANDGVFGVTTFELG